MAVGSEDGGVLPSFGVRMPGRPILLGLCRKTGVTPPDPAPALAGRGGQAPTASGPGDQGRSDGNVKARAASWKSASGPVSMLLLDRIRSSLPVWPALLRIGKASAPPSGPGSP